MTDDSYDIMRYDVKIYTDAINAIHGVYYDIHEYFIPPEICKEHKLEKGICFNYAEKLTIFLTNNPRGVTNKTTVKFTKKDIEEIINIFILDNELNRRKEKILKLLTQ